MERPTVAVVLQEAEKGTGYDDEPPDLEDAVGGRATLRPAGDAASLEVALADADVAFVWDFRTDLFLESFPAAERLRWIHTASAGVDAVLSQEVVDSDVVVTNSRGVFDQGAAEWVVASILVFAKDLLTTLDLQRRKEWVHRESELASRKRVLVVGAGSIGRSIAQLVRALGMQVRGIARDARPDDDDFDLVAASEDLDEHLPWADYVVISAPLTPATEGLFDADRLSKLEPTARLINVGRGPIVRQDDLVEALRSERLAGAALDVFETEPLPADSPLWEMPNVIVSPHCSGDYLGWRERLVEVFAGNLERYVRGEELEGVVDKQRAFSS